MDEDQFASLATGMIKHVARLLSVPWEQAGTMLGVYAWDAQALIDAFLSSPESVAASCGVNLSSTGELSLQRFTSGLERLQAVTPGARAPAPSRGILHILGLRSSDPPAPLLPAVPHADDAASMCGACLEDVPLWRLVSLGCGHEMCDGCWRKHLAAALEEHGKRVHAKVSSSPRNAAKRCSSSLSSLFFSVLRPSAPNQGAQL